MATYKVIQDIEAEDKILGPLTLRQFIYALVALFCFYLTFVVIAKHAGFLAIIFLPPGLFFGFLAFPFGKDQPTEVWALAKLRFLFMPRKRIWDQSGIKELVTITVPKRIERTFTDGLSQGEVKSRLKALANTIDTRGWAIKNVGVNMYRPPTMEGALAGSDRLIDIGSMPQPVPDYDVAASDDMLDEQANPVAQQMSEMIGASTQAHRRQLLDELNGVRQQQTKQGSAPADYWFLNQPAKQPDVPAGNAVFTNSNVVAPGSQPAGPAADDEAALANQLQQNSTGMAISNAHLRTIQPLSDTPKTNQPSVDSNQSDPSNEQQAAAPAPADPVIRQLAGRNDLDVATLARQAKRAQDDDGEVVIPLR